MPNRNGRSEQRRTGKVVPRIESFGEITQTDERNGFSRRTQAS